MRKPQKADLMPWVARLIASPVTRRCRQEFFRLKALPKGQGDVAEVFINPRDPFSLVLLQALPDLTHRFDIQFRFHTIWRQPGEMFPEPGMWLEWAIEDASKLAELYGLMGPARAQPPTEAELEACRNRLLAAEQSADYLQLATDFLKALWQDQIEAPVSKGGNSTGKLEQRLEHNEQRLLELGHYQGGMIHFRGEWFWGIDRLDHLERLLIREGRARDPATTPLWHKTWATVGLEAVPFDTCHPAREQALEVFFSIRSPYSYLGLERAVMLAKAWNIPLRLRPVLPMLMRGQPVPDTKKWYIFQDTKREASKLGLPYGFVADPLGAGVERCYALFDYARSSGREIDYMRSYARAVNAEGIRSETDAGLRIIVERAGLNWQKAKLFLTDQSWRDWAEVNRKAMYEHGLWGVPSFRYGNVSCWGQDRLWLIEEEIRKRAEVSFTQGASVQQ